MDPQPLDYAPPPPSSAGVMMRYVVRITAWVVLVIAAVLIPLPQGIWYFGSHPKLLIAIEWSGLTVGTEKSSEVLGWIPLIAGKLIVLAMPVWLIHGRRTKTRSSRPQ